MRRQPLLAAVLTVALALAGVVTAQEESWAEQRHRMKKELEQLVKERRESPNAPAAWHEARELWAQLKGEQEDLQLAQRERWKLHTELTSRSDYVSWKERIDALQSVLEGEQGDLQLAQRLSIVNHDKRELMARAKLILEERQAALAAAAPPEVPQARELGLTVLNYPRIVCTISVAPLATILACRVLDCPYEWGACGKKTLDPMWLSVAGAHLLPEHLTKSYALQEYRVAAKEVGGEADHRKALVINHLLSNVDFGRDAYLQLIEGKTNLILVSEQPTMVSRNLASEAGVILDSRAIARDALAFLVNHSNPIETLTEDQLRDLFSDQYHRDWLADWRTHGRSINAYLCQRVGKGIQNITYCLYYYARFMVGSPGIKLIGVNGVQPTFDTIRDGTYPYITEVYAVVRADTPPDDPAVILRDWLLTAEGQAVVRESGYVPLPTDP